MARPRTRTRSGKGAAAFSAGQEILYSPWMSQVDVPSALKVPLQVPFPVRPFSLPVPLLKLQVQSALTGFSPFSVVVPLNLTTYLSPLAMLPAPYPRSCDRLPLTSEVNVSVSSLSLSPPRSPCDQVHFWETRVRT